MSALVINLFGGPGTGKSTVASELFAIMKRNNLRVELVNEYVKGHMYSGRTDAIELQEYIFAKQHHKQHILKNKVDYIVTDCPLILSNIYAPDDDLYVHLSAYVLGIFNRYDNLNIFLSRDPQKVYQHYGREQTETESVILDARIKTYLSEHAPYFTLDSNAKVASQIFKQVGELV